MVFKRESGYKLQFVDDGEFEIFCLDCNDTKALKRGLEETGFVENIALVKVVDEKFLEKITGISSCKEDLTAYLNEWFALLASYEVKTYKGID